MQDVARLTNSALKCWEHPKKSGIRIRVFLNANEGRAFGASYLVTVPAKVTGRLRERRQFKDRTEAQEWAKKIYDGSRKQGEDFFSLTESERREVAASIPLLRNQEISVAEAVRFATRHIQPEGRTKALQEAINELLSSKAQRFERGDLRARSYQDFRHRAERFARAFKGRIASEISGAEIKTWLLSLKVGSRSNKNYLAVVGEIFTYATQRRYVAFSPVDSLTDSDRKELCGRGTEAKEPSVLTPDEAKKLLNAALANPKWGLLGAVTLALFCGLRTEELKRLDWEQVKTSEAPAVVTIGAKIAKKRRIRHVTIPDNALLWLSLVPNREGSVASNKSYNDHQKRFKRLLKATGFKTWEPNAMRHSFGSYHYALHGNPLETSRLLGHKASDQVLFDHYRALATKTQAEAYFAIRPPANAGIVLKFA